MSETKYYVPTLVDEKAFDAFKEAFNSYEQTNLVPELNLSFSLPFTNETYSYSKDSKLSEEKEKQIRSNSNKVISTAVLGFSNFRIYYYRTPVNPTPPNGTYGELRINVSGGFPVAVADMHRIVSALIKGLYIGKVDGLPENEKNIIRSYSEVLSKLESLGLEIQRDTKKFRDQLENEFHKKKNLLMMRMFRIGWH